MTKENTDSVGTLDADSADDMAAAVESGEFNVQLADDRSRKELETFVRKTEAGEFDSCSGTEPEATVRLVQAILDDAPEQKDDLGLLDRVRRYFREIWQSVD